METLPFNPAAMGIQPDEIRQVQMLRHRAGHTVYRVVCERKSFVLKWFSDPGAAVELGTYALLESCGVPVLPVHGRSEHGLLLEDLETSAAWRPALEADMNQAATGAAIAEWYRRLHRAGRELLKNPGQRPAFLKKWVTEIDGSSLRTAGEVLALGQEQAWAVAIEYAEPLKSAFQALPQTFNYNDFFVSNLALSRDTAGPHQAIVFDYDQFCLGPAYSDWRNVVGSLRGPGRTAFETAYGAVSEIERILDEPLSILYSLVIASRRDRLPRWAVPVVDMVRNGELERRIQRALEIITV